ncbi:MAG: hypothetical protein WCG92_12260 [Hyphomicrobiales bacterium]|nr:hypothetical protein [Alphaproteobacteria bacterium]
MIDLPTIPVIDVCDGGPLRHAIEGRARALALRDAAIGWFPRPFLPIVPVLDWVARRWLTRSQSPYVEEVKAIAALLGFPGIWFLNGSYQWACTALAREEGGVPWLARTLDWPFPGLGRGAELARMRGPAGEFVNVTWPGYVGALTAMAPGRFAASINQGPMRRRSHGRALRLYDLAANALATLLYVRAIPPDQLLRRVFEEARDYDAARTMLEETPVARPVIYTLAGCRPGDRCVIERTENGFNTRTDSHGAANDWLEGTSEWEGRIGASKIFTHSFEDAAQQSRARREGLALWQGSFERESFGWIAPPVLNPYTRIAVEMCPARGVIRAIGFERRTGEELASPATKAIEYSADRAAA